MELSIQGHKFAGLLHTGTGVSANAQHHWPSTWPTHAAITELRGIGQSKSPLQSSTLLTWEDSEGHAGQFQPHVLPGLPVNL